MRYMHASLYLTCSRAAISMHAAWSTNVPEYVQHNEPNDKLTEARIRSGEPRWIRTAKLQYSFWCSPTCLLAQPTRTHTHTHATPAAMHACILTKRFPNKGRGVGNSRAPLPSFSNVVDPSMSSIRKCIRRSVSVEEAWVGYGGCGCYFVSSLVKARTRFKNLYHNAHSCVLALVWRRDTDVKSACRWLQ